MSLISVLSGPALSHAEGIDPTVIISASGINELKQERIQIQKHLEELPPGDVKSMNGFLGFHSALVPECLPGELLNSRIDVHLNRDMGRRISTIALMPASNPSYGPDEAYGFPKRFRIELMDTVDAPPLKVFDYSKEDFTETRLTPLVITDIGNEANIVRLAVDRGVVKDGWEYFAIGEIFIFCDGEENTRVNITPYSRVETTDSFESHASWSPYYLKDRITAFNMPLGAQTKEETDFVALIPIQEEEGEEAEEGQIQVTIDLGKVTKTGRIEFFPAKPPWEISLPHFGYPGTIQVEGFLTADFTETPVIEKEIANSWDETRAIVLGDIFLSTPIYSEATRFVRITFKDLPMHGTSRVFAMGEISILMSGLNKSKNKTVTISGLTQHGLDPSLLVDNYAYNHEIIHPEQWIIGLAKRHTLENRLQETTAGIARLESRQQRLIIGALIIILVLATTLTLVLYIRSHITRRRDLAQIRRQISSDLHDDVGSSIGAFSMAMERLRNHQHNPAVETITQDLRILAKEASVALREAVWFTRQDSISLQDLGNLIRERATFILGRNKVNFEMDDSLPRIEVSIIHKRNIMLLFKEALHNFIKHAKADQLSISLKREQDDNMVLLIEDDGIGIKGTESASSGWGLTSMEMRAKNIGGELQISSRNPTGTCLKLEIPISNLRVQ